MGASTGWALTDEEVSIKRLLLLTEMLTSINRLTSELRIFWGFPQLIQGCKQTFTETVTASKISVAC
jgi:hypothetical protein